MIFPILSSVILFCVFISVTIKRQTRIEQKAEKSFWDRERRANHTRKKPIDDLAYISIPFESLPTDTDRDNPKLSELVRLLEDLSEQKIVNLTGYTNTDLKLAYGTANITALSEYDQNYTLLARTLQQWAELLFLDGFTDEAAAVLEFAVSTRTDVSRSYYLLADIYDEKGQSFRKEDLISTATTLRSVMKEPIVRTLQGSGPYSDWLHSS